ncbi:MAG TPA: 5-(carboxyamino)imidazole ribonucleotide mutase [Mycobacteriales bacterium]
MPTRTPASRVPVPPPVEIVMGSASDHPVMALAAEPLRELGIASETRVVSAHRTPHDMIAYGQQAAGRGVRVIIAGAGGAAHLPGMLAAVTTLPVIGVPVPSRHLAGVDSLYSIVQMPDGVPVATVGIGAARNAGLLAARLLALHDPELTARLQEYADALAAKARGQDSEIRSAASP